MFTLISAVAGAALAGLVVIAVAFTVANMNSVSTARRETMLRYTLPAGAVAAALAFIFILF